MQQARSCHFKLCFVTHECCLDEVDELVLVSHTVQFSVNIIKQCHNIISFHTHVCLQGPCFAISFQTNTVVI